MWFSYLSEAPLRVALFGTLMLVGGHVLALALRGQSASVRHLGRSATLLAVVLIPVAALLPWRWECLPSWSQGVVVSSPESTAQWAPKSSSSPTVQQQGETPLAGARPMSFPLSPVASASSGTSAAPSSSNPVAQPMEAITSAVFALPTEGLEQVQKSAWSSSWSWALSALWALGTGVLLARLASSMLHAVRSISRAVPAGVPLSGTFSQLAREREVTPRVRLLVSENLGQPLTTGLIRPVVIAPAAPEWAMTQGARTALLHELAHVRRRDVLTQMIGRLAVALYWWNPLAWTAARAQRREAELSCDDSVLLAGTSATEYADCLLASARAHRGSLGALQLAMAGTSGLEERIESALDVGRRRAILPAGWRRAAWVGTAAVGVLAATLSAASPAAGAGQEADTLVVSPDGSAAYATIQAAVDAAASGARIEIRAGRYEEKVRLSKPVTLVGSGWESCQLIAEFDPDGEPTLKVEAPAVVQIQGLRITSLGASESGGLRRGAALAIDGGTAKIQDCAVLGSPASGVVISNDTYATLTGCLIAGAWAEGLVIRQPSEGEGRVLVKDCTIRHNYHNEIMIGGGAPRTRIEGCWISGAGWHGIRYDGSAPEIIGNRLFGNERSGIYASGKTAAHVEGNLFIESGVSCWFENQDTIVGNTFLGNPDGGQYGSSNAAVSIIGGSQPRIERNVITAWPNAVSVGKSSSGGPKNELAKSWAIAGNVLWKNGQSLRVMGEFPELDAEAGNVEADPGFKDAASGDYGLTEASAARAKSAGAFTVLAQESPWALQDEEKPVATGPDSTAARRKRQALQAQSQKRQAGSAATSKAWVDGALQIRDADLRKRSVALVLAALQSEDTHQIEAGLMALQRIGEVAFERAPFEAVTRKLAEALDGRPQVQAFYGLLISREEKNDEDLELLIAEIEEALGRESGGAILGSASHLLLSFSDGQIKGRAGEVVLAMFKSDKADTKETLRGLWGARVSPEVGAHIVELARKGSRNRHDAIYFGLSTFYEKSPEVLEALFEACEDPDHNNSGRALWGLTYGVPEESHADVADFLLLLFEARSSASIRRECLQGLRSYAGTEHLPKLRSLASNDLLTEELRASLQSIVDGIDRVGEGDK